VNLRETAQDLTDARPRLDLGRSRRRHARDPGAARRSGPIRADSRNVHFTTRAQANPHRALCSESVRSHVFVIDRLGRGLNPKRPNTRRSRLARRTPGSSILALVDSAIRPR
jgi:hypothetical protein